MPNFILQEGLRRDYKLWGSLANEPGMFIDEELHATTVPIEAFPARDWKAAREYVADKYFV